MDRSKTVLPDTHAEAASEGTGVDGRPFAGTAPGVFAGSRLDRVIWAVAGFLRRNWLFAVLVTAGLILRAMAQIGYEPALLVIDSRKYIFGLNCQASDWGSYDA